MDMLLTVLSHWESVVAVLLVLGGLIFFHELGHFSVARLFGVGVRTFSLGFGPKLITRRVGRTDYCLSMVPLGGYVSLVGQDVEEDEAATETPDSIRYEAHESYAKHPAWQRMFIILAGPVANFILAVLIYWGVAWYAGETFLQPVVGATSPDSPAAVAGIQPGDRIVSINGTPIEQWGNVSEHIDASQGQPVDLELSRNGEALTLRITPQSSTRVTLFGEEKPAWLIGVAAGNVRGTRELSALQAMQFGFRQTWNMTVFTLEGIQKLFQRVVPLDNVGGPIMIAQLVGQQAQESLVGVFLLAALISVNLGILNLLPIPVLDGGHILFCLLEMTFRRPVTERVQEASARVGMAMLFALMIFATWNDLVRLFS